MARCRQSPGGALVAGGARRGIATTRFSIPRVPGHRSGAFPSTGGEPVAATRFEAEQRGHFSPHFLPNQRHFLFFVAGPPDTRGVYVGQLGDTSSRRLVDADGPAVFTPATGHLLFVRGGKLLAQAFDAGRLGVRWEPAGHRRTRHSWDGPHPHRVRGRAVHKYHKPPPGSVASEQVRDRPTGAGVAEGRLPRHDCTGPGPVARRSSHRAVPAHGQQCGHLVICRRAAHLGSSDGPRGR